MAMWEVYKRTTRLDTGVSDPKTGDGYYIAAVDDGPGLNAQVAQYFGPERTSIVYESPTDGLVTAKVQYTPNNPPPSGWVRDRDTSYEYIVYFTCRRQG